MSSLHNFSGFEMIDESGAVLAKCASGEDLIKAHVKGYTRSDGTFVAEHDDSRPAASSTPSKKQPGSWSDAHDYAVNASYSAWNGGSVSHEHAVASLKNSIRLHKKAAQAALDHGDQDAHDHHMGKVADHEKSISQHQAHLAKNPSKPESSGGSVKPMLRAAAQKKPAQTRKTVKPMFGS